MKTLLKIFLLFLLTISIFTNANPQKPITWQKVFGLDSLIQGTYGIQTSDGGYAILGRWDPISAYPNWTRVLKLDKYGNLIWTKNYGVKTYYYLIENSDSGFVLVGAGGAGDGASLLKTNKNGDSLIYKIFGGAFIYNFNSIKKFYDDGFILNGEGGNGTYHYIYMVRLDKDFNLIWENIYTDGNYNDIFSWSVNFDKNNNISVTIRGDDGQSDGGILKLNSNGNLYLKKWHHTDLINEGYGDIILSKDKYYIGGGASNFISDSLTSLYCIIDTNGNLLFRKYFYDAVTYYAKYSFMVKASGNYFVLGGYSDEIRGHRKMALRKIDYSGNIIWTNVINDALSISTPANIKWTSDNGYLLTGSYGEVDAYCIYVIKTDSNAYAEPVGISNQFFQIPNKFILHPAFPNPFNGSVKIRYEIKQNDNYKMKIFNVNGKSLALVFDENLTPGNYEKNLNGYFTDLSSSVYFISLENGEQVLTRKLLFIK